MADSQKLKIAILGATGYIGRSLLATLLEDPEVVVTGYSRDKESGKKILSKYKIKGDETRKYEELLDHQYDVVINATGVGSPKKLAEDPSAVFEVTESMDRTVVGYMNRFPEARTYNLSSGAVYGRSAGSEVGIDSLATFDINSLSIRDGYALAKLHSEARHRALGRYAIVDLRVFAFVSRYLDPEDSFLVSEIAKCLKENKVIRTKPDDLVRDFTTAHDIIMVIKFLQAREATNDVFDLKSATPLSKFELLDYLKKELGLEYQVEDLEESSPTGGKSVYAPKDSRLERIGYVPKKSSLKNVTEELQAFLLL